MGRYDPTAKKQGVLFRLRVFLFLQEQYLPVKCETGVTGVPGNNVERGIITNHRQRAIAMLSQ